MIKFGNITIPSGKIVFCDSTGTVRTVSSIYLGSILVWQA